MNKYKSTPPCNHAQYVKGCVRCYHWLKTPKYRIKLGGPPVLIQPKEPEKESLKCKYLGEETGEQDTCKTCKGTIPLPIYSCKVKEECNPNLKRTAEIVQNCRNCESYSPANIIIEHGAGGLGDALQGLCVVNGLPKDIPIEYNCGYAGQEACNLFEFKNIILGTTKSHVEDTAIKYSRQMNLGYMQEYADTFKISRWHRYANNIQSPSFNIPELKQTSILFDIKNEYAGHVVLCPFSTENARNLPIHIWHELEQSLLNKGYKTVVLHNSQVKGFKGKTVINENIKIVTNIIAACAIAVGVDSGLMHLAGILKVPALVLGGRTKIEKIFDCYPLVNTLRETDIKLHNSITILKEIEKLWSPAVHSLVSEDRRVVIRNEVLKTNHLEGECAEFGVYKGGIAKLILHVATDTKLHLFDTFEGIPETDILPGGHIKDDFNDTSLTVVKQYLNNPNVEYHQGIFPTNIILPDVKFRFVHIDADTFQSTLAAIEYFWPRLVEEGVLIFDDYKWEKCPGVEKALHMHFPTESIEQYALYQAVIRKPKKENNV